MRILLFLFFFWLAFCYGNDDFIMPEQNPKMEKLYNTALEHIQKQEFRQAVRLFQEILETYPNELFAVDKYLSVKISHLIHQHLATIQNKWLESASEIHKIKTSATLYYPEGQEYWIQKIEETLIQEKYQESLSYLQTWLEHIKEYNEETLQNISRILFCYYALGYQETLNEWLERKDDFLTNNICIAGQNTTLQNFIQKQIQNLQKYPRFQNTNWSMLAGKTTHSFVTPYPVQIYNNVDKITIPKHPRENIVRRYVNEATIVRSGPPLVYPAYVDNVLYISNGGAVYAYDLVSMKQLWCYQMIPSIISESHEQAVQSVLYHDNAIYATLEVRTSRQIVDNWNVYQIRKILAERRLFKINATTGNLEWYVRGKTDDEEEFENKISFMTPPTVWNGKLYCGVTETTGLFNSYIVALDPQTGKIIWKKMIGSAQQELNIFNNPVRESIGSKIVAGNGRLYYLNHLGAICAVNPIEENITWIRKYDRIPLPTYTESDQAALLTHYRPASWYNCPLIFYKDKLYFAPIDSYLLYCIDAISGEKIWEYRRTDATYLLGVQNDKVIISGKNILFLDAHNGKHIQTIQMFLENTSGYGMIHKNTLYYPGRKSIYEIDIPSMKVIKNMECRHDSQRTGHIINSAFYTIVATHNDLYIYSNLKQMEARLQKAYQDDASLDNLWNLAEFYIKDNKTSKKALKMYEQIQKIAKAKSNDYYRKANERLKDYYIQQAKNYQKIYKSFPALRSYQQAETYIQDENEHISILLEIISYAKSQKRYNIVEQYAKKLNNLYGDRTYPLSWMGLVYLKIYVADILGDTYIKQKQWGKAVDVYQNIIETVPVEHTYKEISATQWAIKQIDYLIKEQGQKIYQEYNRKAQKQHENAKLTKNYFEYEQIAQKYPNYSNISEIYLEQAQILYSQDKFQECIDLIYSNNLDTLSQKEQFIAIIIECFEKKQSWKQAKKYLFQLQKESENSTEKINGMSIVEWIQKKLSQKIYSTIPTIVIPQFHFQRNARIRVPFYQKKYKNDHKVRILTPIGDCQESNKDLLFLTSNETLYCLDGKTGKEIWTNSSFQWIYEIGFIGEYLYAWSQEEIYQVDRTTGKILQKQPFPKCLYKIQLDYQIIAVLCQNKNEEEFQLQTYSLDLQPQWKKTLSVKEINEFQISEEYIILCTVEKDNLHIYAKQTGLLKKFFQNTQNKSDVFPYSIIIFENNGLCIVNDNTRLDYYSLNPFQKQWSYFNTFSLFNTESKRKKVQITANEDTIFVIANKKIIGLNVHKGTIKWQSHCQDQYIQQLLVDSKNLYFLEKRSDRKYLTKVSAQHGKISWVQSLVASRVQCEFLHTPEYIIALANQYSYGYKSWFMIYDKNLGRNIWQQNIDQHERGNSYSQMALSGNHLWILQDNILYGW